MFIRRKKNRSGSTSIVVIDKSKGKFRELKTIGTSSDSVELEKMYQDGKRWITSARGERDVFAETTRKQEEKQVTNNLLDNIENILLNGTQLILLTSSLLTLKTDNILIINNIIFYQG